MYNATTKDASMTDVKNAASNIRDEAVNTAYGVKDDLTGAANKAGRKVRNLFSCASDEISHVSDTVTKEIRTNPVQSSMIALGAGFLLGALFRR